MSLGLATDVDSPQVHPAATVVWECFASACKTGNPEPSDVLLAMGYPPELALGSLRLTAGIHTTEEDIAFALNVLAETVEKVRHLKLPA